MLNSSVVRSMDTFVQNAAEIAQEQELEGETVTFLMVMLFMNANLAVHIAESFYNWITEEA